MPKYHPNTRFTDCWASVGNITFYHRDGQCYFRAKAKPVFPGTSHQQVQLSIHKRALQAWRNISHEEQLEWNALATQVRSKRVKGKIDFPQIGFEKGTTERGFQR